MRRLIGALMVVAGVFLIAQAVADSAVGAWLLAGASPASSASISGIDRVTVTSGGGQVRIVVEDRPDLYASMQGAHADRAAVRLNRRGRELRIEAFRPWLAWPYLADQVILDVRIPAAFNGALCVEIRSGTLEVSGTGGPSLEALELELRSGLARLTEIDIRSLRITVRSGQVTAQGVTAHEATVDQSSGLVRLDRYAGPLEADVSSGSLSVTFASISGPVSIDQSSGTLLLELPLDAGFDLDVRMRSGLFSNELPAAPSTGDVRSGMRATYGNGGPRVRVQASSGWVTLRPASQ